MSSAPVRRVSPKDIQVVQNLIERCLQLYMNQREVVETLLAQAKIEPGFTELVWQKLEEENKEFFKAYYARLMVKRQIIEFNRLLEQQVQLMRQINPSAVGPIQTSNGSHIPQLHQNSACYAPEHTGPALKAEIHQFMASSLPNAFTNGGSSLQSAMHTAVEMSSHANRIDTPGNMLPMQSSNMGLLQGMNGAMIKSEAGYSSNSPYLYGADGNVLETRQSIVDVPVTSFSSVESNSQALNNEPLIDVDTSSFGFLGQIPRNFSLSDLTADFAQNILENYPRSPFVGTDNESFLDSRDRENQGESKRLDTISEGVSYDDFGSE